METVKGQSEVVTFVMLSGVVVALVGAAYMWGAPLTEKRSSMAESESIVAFLNVLDTKIQQIAQTCTGTCTESLDISQKGVFSSFDYERYYKGIGTVNEFNNSILLNVSAARNVYALDRWIGINTGNMNRYVNYGEKEGVTMVRMIKTARGEYESVYRLWYREIDTQNKGFLIELETGPIRSATTGKITITYTGRFIVTNGAANGKDLEVGRLRIDFT